MSDVAALARFIEAHPRLFVLSGAGCSTASGIPDYRDRDGGWKRRPPVTLQAFDHAASPPFVSNMTGPEVLSVREVSDALGRVMKREVKFAGVEARDALLSNASLMVQQFGAPTVPTSSVLEWTADWVMRGGASHGKPTHFEARDGKF